MQRWTELVASGCVPDLGWPRSDACLREQPMGERYDGTQLGVAQALSGCVTALLAHRQRAHSPGKEPVAHSPAVIRRHLPLAPAVLVRHVEL